MSTLEAAFGQLPEPILNKLDSMIRRVRRLLFLRGLFSTLAVALACLLTIMIIDASVTLFSSASRWALSLIGLAITVAAAWRFLVRPLSKKFTLTHMARILEIRHPELQERISTAVELLSSDDPDSIRGSGELIAAVVDSAVEDVQAVDPETEFNPTKTRKFRNVSIAFGGALLLSLLIWPRESSTLLTRALAPFLDIGNAYADSLVVDPGDIRIAQGDSVSIEVSVKHKRLRRAEIRRLMPDGSESVERMTLIGEDADGTKRFSTTFPNVDLGFNYRIRAGSALTRYYDVEAVAPPTVDELTIAYDYPDYTALESTREISDTGEIRAVSHTMITVEAKVNKPVQASHLLINGATDLGNPEVSGNTLRWDFALKPGMKGNWQLDLTDTDGFANPATTYPLEGLPDKAPNVLLTRPMLRELKMRPTERLQLHADVTEDFGVGDVALLVTPQGATQPIEVPQPDLSPGNGLNTYLANAVLDLASLSLRPEQKRLTVQMRVRDNRPSDYDGPGVGLSEMIHIEINRLAKSLADQAIEAQKKEVGEALREAKQELEEARDDLRRTEDILKRDEEVSREARERLEDFSEHSEKARNELDKVAAALDNSLFEEQAEMAGDVSNETIAEARERADLVPVLDEKSERVEEAREAREKIEEAIRQVDEISKEMQEAEDDYEMISDLNELSNKQQELAMNAEQMAEQARQNSARQDPSEDSAAKPELSPEERRKLEEFQQKQEQLQQELGQMLKDNAAALSEILEEERADAQAMAEQAAELAGQQQEIREMSKKALEADQNREDVLRDQLLAFLEKEQSQLAADAAVEAAQAGENARAQQSARDRPESPSPADAETSPSSTVSSEQPERADNGSEPAGGEPSPAGEEASSLEGEAAPSTPEQAEQTDPTSPERVAESAPSGESPAPDTPETATPEQALANQLSEAAQQAADAAEALGQENLEAASESANEASDSLAEAASQAGENSSSGKEESAATKSGEESSSEAESDSAETGEPAMASNSPSTESGQSSSEEPSGDSPTSDSSSSEPGTAEVGNTGESTPSAGELAERQAALAEQIEAVKNGDLEDALARIESQLAREADALQNAANALEENMENLSQNSARSGADRAEQALSRGAQKADEATNQLAQAQQQQSQAEAQSQVEPGELSQGAQEAMNRGLAEQQRTADYLEQAAQALQATSEAIGQTQEGLEPSDMDERIADSSDLANGFEEMSQSAQSQSTQEAAQQSQEAANAMQQLAQAAMQKLGMPGDPSRQTPPGQPMPPQQLTGEPDSETLNESGLKAADADGSGIPPELQNLGISVEDWAKFRGALVGGSATAIETDLPAEYRELVGRYFQVIAKEAAKKK